MSSDSDEEDFVTYGTPLDTLEEEAITKKRAFTIEDQVATDKHGHRRFHGAFTGGFSAGFYNTVGSLEGWKPSQFKSSRSAKSQAQFQRPEDFMDDEDMDEFGFAPKTIRTTGDYNQGSEGSSRKRSLMQFSDGPIPGVPVLKSLVEPTKETIGIRLLMKMGWKPGQGVGPKLTKAEKSISKKSRKLKKVYGCALPTQDEQPEEEADEDSEEDEELGADVTFAPDDYEPYIVKPKDDTFGLGYSGLDRRPVLSSHIDLFGPAASSLVMEEKKKKVSIRGQAFGVGAFEKDDEDIYAAEDMSQYDFALDTPKMLAEKRQQHRNAKLALPSSSKDILEGFLAMSRPVVRKRYPPPPLPQGFTPHHQIKQSRFNVATGSQGHVTRLTANERTVLVNNEMTQKASPLPQEQTTSEAPMPVEVERTVGTFRPFVADPEKQLRYEKFLTLIKLCQTEKLKSLQPLAMTEWEQERERAEFEQAARLYRPLSDAFSDHFVSASQPDSATDPLAPVARSAAGDEDLKSAAKMKMFGRLTRKISEWQPHSVLCKRFNIPQPGGTSSSMKPRISRPKFSVFNFLEAAPFNAPATISERNTSTEEEVMPQAAVTVAPTPPPTTAPAPQESKMEVTAKDNDLDQLIDSTNKMDLYKAIFLSSSDESDEEEKLAPSSISTVSKQPTATELNVLRDSSPPRGIFANLDLDALKKSSVVQEKSAVDVNVLGNMSPPRGIFANLDFDTIKKKNQTTTDKVAESSENNRESEEPPSLNVDESFMYGPSLPKSLPILQKPVNFSKENSSESDEDWVELNNSSDSSKAQSNKKHSKKSHRKSKKQKKKHKHKKKRN